MSGLYSEAMTALLEELRGSGVRATDDPVAVNPPCAVVEPPVITRLSMGHYGVSHRVHLVAPGGTGTYDAIATLDAMLESVLELLDPDEITPSTYTLGSTGDGAPALTLTLERSI